ncbi:MAG TPA: alpha/beta fold hydrolase [Candidatus Methylomirabilis sp.]|nr:alpha/beta fold hydrolase [Candidatus Methylomirabilis sp.]
MHAPDGSVSATYVEVSGVSTYLERRGRGWPVVLVHALGMNLRSWDPVAEVLAEHFEVVAYDYLGHGRTEKVLGRCTIPILAAHLRDLLACLALGPAPLVGLAVGSMIAQQLALQEPGLVSALVLASPRSELDPRGARYNEERADTVEAQGMRAVMDLTIQRAFPQEYGRSHPEVMRRFRGEFLANDPHGYAAVCRGLSTFCTTPLLHEIRCPTLLLAGELDQLCPVRESVAMQSRITGSRCETLPGVGHFSAMEAPAQFAQRVLTFLRSLTPRAH